MKTWVVFADFCCCLCLYSSRLSSSSSLPARPLPCPSLTCSLSPEVWTITCPSVERPSATVTGPARCLLGVEAPWCATAGLVTRESSARTRWTGPWACRWPWVCWPSSLACWLSASSSPNWGRNRNRNGSTGNHKAHRLWKPGVLLTHFIRDLLLSRSPGNIWSQVIWMKGNNPGWM